MSLIKWTFGCLALLFCTAAPAFDQAVPPIKSLTPNLEVFPQHFEAAHGPDGLLYVASAEGVLRFDGVSWRLIPLPNHARARSLAVHGDRIYVGGDGLYGVLQRADDGSEQFELLSAQLPDEVPALGEVMDVIVTPTHAWFRAGRVLIALDHSGRLTGHWEHAGGFSALAWQHDALWVNLIGKGLYRYEDGELVAVQGGHLTSQFNAIIGVSDGLLIPTLGRGWWRFGADGLHALEGPQQLPKASRVYDHHAIEDGRVVLGLKGGELWIYDPSSDATESFRVSYGALSSVGPALGGGLLVTDYTSINYVAWPSPVRIEGASSGLLGAIHRVRQWGGRRFVLSSEGIQELQDGRWEMLGWAAHAAWDLLPLDGERALLAETHDLLLIENDRPQAVARHIFPSMLMFSERHPDTVLVGTYNGVAILRRSDADWRLQTTHVLDFRVDDLVEMSPQVWWAASNGGVRRIRLSSDLETVEQIDEFGIDDGIEFGAMGLGTVSKLHNQLLVSTENGLYRFDGEGFVESDLDGLGALLDGRDAVALAAGPGGTRWAHTYNQLWHYLPGSGWQEIDLASALQGALGSTLVHDDGSISIGASGSVLRVAVPDHRPLDRGRRPKVALDHVLRKYSDGTQVRLSRSQSPVVSQDDLQLQFRLAMLDIGAIEAVQFQSRLTGFEAAFNEWSSGNTMNYSGLLPGDYVFEARGKNGLGEVTQITPYRFTVQHRWYQQAGMRWAAGVLLVGLLLAMGRWRSQRLQQRTAKLERLVNRRTEELTVANRQLEAIANIDRLTGLPNRRRLDEYLRRVWDQCQQQQRSLGLLMADVDHFKDYNDTYGHLQGDELLRRRSETMTACLQRAEDIVARYGGEEFVVVMPGAPAERALDLAETIRESVAVSDLGVTISIGVTSCVPSDHETLDMVFGRADRALYRAKRDGRNLTRLADPTPPA